MTRKHFTLLAASALLALGSSTISSPAQADNLKCPADRFCLFEHDNFGGGRAVFAGSNSDLRNVKWENTNRVVDNGGSSMINNRGGSVSLRSNAGTCAGDSYTALAESEDRSFTNNFFDNQASCVQVN